MWFNSCMQVQSYVYTCSKKIQSPITVSTGLKILKIFKVQLQLHKVEKFQKIFNVQFKSAGFEKNSKNFQSPTQARPEWKNFKGSKYKCLVVKCQKILKIP